MAIRIVVNLNLFGVMKNILLPFRFHKIKNSSVRIFVVCINSRFTIIFFCEYNFLTALPPLPDSMIYLYCTHNSLTNIPSLPPNLYLLYCSTNSLTSLPPLPIHLEILSCVNNLLTSLPVLPNSLEVLSTANNQLTSLPVLPPFLSYLACPAIEVFQLTDFRNKQDMIEMAEESEEMLVGYLQC